MNLETIKGILLSKDGIACAICAIVVLIALLAVRIVVKGINNNKKWVERTGIGIVYLLFILVIIGAMMYFSVVDINQIKALFNHG